MIPSNRFAELDQAQEDIFDLFSRPTVEYDTENTLDSLYQSDQYPNVFHPIDEQIFEPATPSYLVGDLVKRRSQGATPLADAPDAETFYQIIEIRVGDASIVGRPFVRISKTFLDKDALKLGVLIGGSYSCNELVQSGQDCIFPRSEILDEKYEFRYFKPTEGALALSWAHQSHNQNQNQNQNQNWKKRFFYRYRYLENEATSDLAFFDAEHVKPAPSGTQLRVLDLFAGCGGFSFGLSQAGLDVLFGVEVDEDAAKTLLKNHSREFHVIPGDAIGNLRVIRDIVDKMARADPEKYGHLPSQSSDWIIEEPPRHSVETITEVRWVAKEGGTEVLMAKFYVIGSDDVLERPLSQVSHGTAFKAWKMQNPDEWFKIKQQILRKRAHGSSFRKATDYEATQPSSSRLADLNVSMSMSIPEGSQQQQYDANNDEDDINLIEKADVDASVSNSSEASQKEKEKAEENLKLRAIVDWKVGDKNDEILFQLEEDFSGGVPWVPESSVDEGRIMTFYQRVINEIPHRGTVDIIVGGPPCQDFSRANTQSRLKGETFFGRNGLVLNFLDWVSFIQPRFVVIENVLGMLDFKVPQQVTAQLLAWGYQVRIQIVAATAYGVPQARSRVFIFAAKSGEKLPKLPPATHYMEQDKLIKHNTNVFSAAVIPVPEVGSEHLWEGLQPCPTVKDALCDLPENLTPSGVCEYRTQAKNAYQAMMRHNTTTRDSKTMTRQHYAPERVGTELLDGDSYAVTITTKKPIMHYKYKRLLTVREVARLFGYPDCFDFPGTKLAEMYKQLGNSVAPPVAFVIGRSLVEAHLATKVGPLTPNEVELQSFAKFETRPWQKKMYIHDNAAEELWNNHRIRIKIRADPSLLSSSKDDKDNEGEVEESDLEYGGGPAKRIKRPILRRSARPSPRQLEEAQGDHDEEPPARPTRNRYARRSRPRAKQQQQQSDFVKKSMLRYSGDGLAPTEVYDSGSDSESACTLSHSSNWKNTDPPLPRWVLDDLAKVQVWVDIEPVDLDILLEGSNSSRRIKKRKLAPADDRHRTTVTTGRARPGKTRVKRE